jgi:hypothetical protein
VLYKDRDPGGLFVETEAPFHRITELTGCGARQNPAFIVVELPLEHPGLPEALRIIQEETGRIPTPNTTIRRRQYAERKYFSARITRQYEEKDLRVVPYLGV